MRRTRTTSERGFTLTEILVTTTIFAVIMIAALAVYDRSNRVFKSGTESADLQQSGRIAFDKLTSDLRMAGFDYSRGGTPSGAIGATLWSASTSFSPGVQVDPGNGLIFTCAVGGTTGASAPTWNMTVGGSTTDGSVKWTTASMNQFAQMDEQLEYAGPTAVAFRANFDYNTDSSHGNGLEDAEGYTPVDPKTLTKIFPYVTTGNDEIIAYVLRSADPTKNTGAISFWVDASKPRSAYPGGTAEAKVTIGASQGITGATGITPASCSTCGIDITNANPPYTLYRVSVDDVVSGGLGTPIAENIRSVNYYYYSDANAGTLLKNLDGPPATDISVTHNADGSTPSAKDSAGAFTGAVGGDGKYDPNNSATTNFTDRSIRSQVQSIRVTLVAMGSNPEPGYTNAAETLTAFKNYHEYPLQAVIVPRNFGLIGFPEPANTTPGQPQITGMCTGYCAAPVLTWAPPSGGSAVQKYVIAWDTNSQGCFCAPNTLTILDPTQTTAIIPDGGSINPSLTWYYEITAFNDSGAGPASLPYSVVPKNSTKPSPPSGLAATTATQTHAVNPANTDYAVSLTWTAPSTNDPSLQTTTCTGQGCTANGSVIPSQENVKFNVWRGITSTFDPGAGQGVQVLQYADASQPTGTIPGQPVAWKDSPATSDYPPGTCVQYYYRVQALDRCSTVGTYNVSGSTNDATSTYSPAAPGPAPTGQAYDSGAQAIAPTVTLNLGSSACPKAPSTNCQIKFSWPKVAADTSGNTIGVDAYAITRARKKAGDPSYVLDTTFGTSGTLKLTGQSQNNSLQATYTDTTAPAFDVDFSTWYYEYTVAASDCRPGQVSVPVDYPTVCTIGESVTPTGSSGGTGSAASPWILDSTDSISVTGGTGVTSVEFIVTIGATTVTDTVDSSAPFTLSWPSGLTAGSTYTVTVKVTSSIPCSDTKVKYVEETPSQGCAIVTNQAEAAPVASTHGSTTSESETYNITNVTLPDTMTLGGQAISIKWARPDALHNDMTLDTIDWGCTTANPAAGPGTVSSTIPACVGTLATGGTAKTFKLIFNFSKFDPDLTTTAGLQKICVQYTIPAEPGVTKHCNLVGQAASTSNPNACD